MSNKKRTAVEWMITCINARIDLTSLRYWDEIQSIVNAAKEMEREQIEKAANNGCKGMCMIDASRDGKNYYEQTYGNHNGDVNKMVGGQDESLD